MTVLMLFTGGTISMAPDPGSGGHVPRLSGAEILATTPGLSDIAEVEAVDHTLMPASHFTFDHLRKTWYVVAGWLDEPDVTGAVVVQGTDTIEESSFAWDLWHSGSKPVLVTGAMRTSADADFDGPRNLRTAVTIAAAPEARGIGVAVAFGERFHPADDATKSHSLAVDPFRSHNAGPLGRVEEGRIVVERARGPRRPALEVRPPSSRVFLVQAGVDTDGTLIDAAIAAGAEGIVVAATGAGNTSPGMLAAGQAAMERGIPVVLSTRCAAGPVAPLYAFEGGGATWVRAGALTAGSLCSAKARVALALGIGAGLDRDALAGLLADPVAA
jgi:L-asparaginase